MCLKNINILKGGTLNNKNKKLSLANVLKHNVIKYNIQECNMGLTEAYIVHEFLVHCLVSFSCHNLLSQVHI